MLLTKKHAIISSSFILTASLCTITLLTKQNTQLDSTPTNIEAKETITLASSEPNEPPTFRSSLVNNTHTFRGDMGTVFDFSGLGDLKITIANIGTNAFTYAIKSQDEEQLASHTIQPNESKTFTLRSFVSSPEPGPYYLSAYNADGSESSMRLLVQPE
ncbi:hypothetical protein BCJMU51_2987 [Bacillus cereus]|uniref:hypothetical protein n=1 Tax=Bacillus TaxID=1386 RepID=UPI0007783C61|nr:MULTISPECIES: hypothetical protein [Bacillus]KXY86632.1 hypothetical protein AT280_21935 [Bacillus cereus]KYZ68302.1 hypothetical protein A3782_16720 [Bacillus sp. GZT]MCU5323243.1 hypothetical protein [Bacillus cereus]MCU5717621.1 hypothetical protein [Bacillus cereus]MDA1843455.1 hypothetical protein [Bacillus cereus]